MYLEPVQSFSAFPVPSNAVMCSSNTKYAGRILYGKVDVNSESGCGGIVKQVTPPAPTPSTALFSYDLTGTATSWSYPSCKTGYTRKASGKAHPNAYTCFASTAAQVSASVQNKCAPVRWSCSDGTQRMAHTDARPPDCDPCSAVGLRGKII